ncbi:hypothetical protein PB1_02500 [Bacillus methanolicus PB1]|uniref:Uncharacterized protein n=1 Tax=Bacillus methanolicus PB1 TaxID=997296 RepID=I3E5K2_BACMT|nr:hypothetical protein [Bacillus methanolicus]EIJ81773.1 hypothetical protein PB1_02500 [Bacillus methanolicus PB1]
MTEQLIFDITSCEEALKSLEAFLDLNEREIVKFIANNKGDISSEDFIEAFNISEEKLLSKELLPVSLHVTTNNDNCATIKKFGLMDLQKAVTLDTPLNRYLKSMGITIDVENKEIHYKDKVYDISKKYNGINAGSKDESLNSVIHKLFIDFQINSFFYDKNVLNYDGDIRRGPEFLINLANLLRNSDIENIWKQNKDNKCYVIKFFAPLSKYTNYSFLNYVDEDWEEEALKLEMVKAIIKKSLYRIHDDIFYDGAEEGFSYIKPHEVIPFSNIIKIYSEEEYLEAYNIKEESTW